MKYISLFLCQISTGRKKEKRTKTRPCVLGLLSLVKNAMFRITLPFIILAHTDTKQGTTEKELSFPLALAGQIYK